jgi:hypothetical protein
MTRQLNLTLKHHVSFFEGKRICSSPGKTNIEGRETMIDDE